MITRREVAQRLDIPLEMATRHGIPARMTEAELAQLETSPPPWLTQSRANRPASGRPVWMQLRCDVCGATETARPKKWWPAFTYITCLHHAIWELPGPAEGMVRVEYDGVADRFVGIVDTPVSA